MSISSNLYAEKAFSEQPIALWSLDDAVDYVSLISEEQRDLSNLSIWTATNGSCGVTTDVVGEPFDASIISTIQGSVPGFDSEITELLSTEFISYSSFNEDLKTFSIAGYFYSPSPFLSGITIGYRYYDSDTSSYIESTKTFNISIAERWLFVSETFDLPPAGSDVGLILRLSYLPGGSDPSSYLFLNNGLSVGQWSEEFQAISLGVDLEDIPSNIALDPVKGYPATAYGLLEATGYYLGNSNSLVAKNTGIPLVYGASNNTTLLPADGPSLIVPGQGFLNEIGKYQEYTAEFWLRLNASTIEPKRIFGPIASDDGIYVDGPFIKIKINDVYDSYFVGEWFRPMLIDFQVINNSASLLINGEEVISVNIDTDSLILPAKSDELDRSQDWLGFYSYEDTTPFEIDAVGIYPYSVPAIVAKRRWVYGQGVEYPEKINTAFNGVTALIDYPFAKYANNYSFPDSGRWKQGLLDNVSVTSNILQAPSYETGVLKFNNKTASDWESESSGILTSGNEYISLKPTASWNSTEGCVIFSNINILQQDTKAVYGLFQSRPEYTGVQTLFKFQDQITGNYLLVELDSPYIYYKLYYNGTMTTLHRLNGHHYGDFFMCGIDIKTFSSYFGGNVASLLGNKNQLRVYAGGSEDFENTFGGKIYRIGFSTERNFNKIKELFNQFGVMIEYEDVFDLYTTEIPYDGDDPDLTNGSLFADLFLDGGDPWVRYTPDIEEEPASYGLIGKSVFGKASLDIEVDSYWEDYVPLTKLAKTILNEDGEEEYGIDFIQLNINYPAPQRFSEGFYDTDNQDVKTYITFQPISDGASAPETAFRYKERMPQTGVVSPGSDWRITKYEVVDGAIVYLPVGVDFNDLGIVTHIEMKISGISNSPVKIKNLQLASQSLSQQRPAAVGTRFGKNIYPYTKSGLYFDYKSKNPFRIYKGSTPYLYLTGKSGIRPSGSFDDLTSRGLSIPINPEKSDNFETVAVNMAMRFDFERFPDSPVEIFEIEASNQYTKFYVVSIHPEGKRGKIYSQNVSTGRLSDRIVFYWNGNLVREPVVELDSWGFFGAGFTDNLLVNNIAGAIRITGPVAVDSISHYQASSLDQARNQITRKWFGVESIGGVDIDWRYWAEGQDNPEGNQPYTWSQVLVVSPSDYYGVDPEAIYKSFVGTNKIIASDFRELRLSSYQYSVYKDLEWTTNTITPV